MTDEMLLTVTAGGDRRAGWDAYRQSLKDWRDQHAAWQRDRNERAAEDIADDLAQVIRLLALPVSTTEDGDAT